MFRVKSSCKTQLEIEAPVSKVRDFFRNLSNFTDLLGGVDNIRRESGGIARWTIATDTPVGRTRLSASRTAPESRLGSASGCGFDGRGATQRRARTSDQRSHRNFSVARER